MNGKATLWLLGGILVATGVLAAVLGGFGMPEGPASISFSQVGNDGLDNLTIFPQGYAAIALFLVGVGLLSAASKDAWKQTGGY